MRGRAVFVSILVLAGVAGIGLGSCLDLSWKEGISCDERGQCPKPMRCCEGVCRTACAGDAGPPAPIVPDGGAPMSVMCPAQEGGCYGCMPGCSCTCGGGRAICCLRFGVATCLGCL